MAVPDGSRQEHRTCALLRSNYLKFEPTFRAPQILLWNSGLSSPPCRSAISPNTNSNNYFVCTFVVSMPDNFGRIRNWLCKCVGIAGAYVC